MKEIQLFELLGDIYRRIFRSVAPVAQAEGLSMTEMLVVWKMLSRDCRRVKEILADIGLPPSTMTGVLDRLTAAGWLARETDPEDRRAVVMRRTEKLDRFMRALLRERDKTMAAVFRRLPRDLVTRLTADLAVVHEILDTEGRKE